MTQTKAQLLDGKSATIQFTGGSASAPAISFTGDTNTGIYSPGADQVAISTNGTGRLFVDASGSIGIGTSTIRSQVHLYGVNQDTANLADAGSREGFLRLSANSTAAGAGGAILFANIQGDGANSLGFAAIKGLLTDGSNNTAGDIAFSTRPTSTSTSFQERLRITSDGKVGLGTSSPVATLDVGGSTATSNGGLVNVNFFAGFTPTGGGNTFGGIVAGAGVNGNTPFIAASRNGAGTGLPLTFFTDGAERVRIDSQGRVGVGTTPGFPFQVKSTTDAHIALWDNGGIPQVVGVNDAGGSAQLRLAGQILSFTGNGGAGSEHARIDTSGRLLMGTSSSSAEAKFIVQGGATGSGGGMNIQRSVTTASAGSTIGFINFTNSSNDVGATVIAEGDGTWSAGTSHPTRLVFSTTADGASSPTERMRITKDGYIQLDGSTGAVGMRIGSAGQLLLIADNGGLFHQANGSYYLVTTAGGSTSDIRLKKDIIQITEPLQKLSQIRGVTFIFSEEPVCDADKGQQIGVIAQEVESVFPQAVVANEQGIKSVRYDKLVAPLIEAVNTLAATIANQSALIEDLAQRLAVLESH